MQPVATKSIGSGRVCGGKGGLHRSVSRARGFVENVGVSNHAWYRMTNCETTPYHPSKCSPSFTKGLHTADVALGLEPCSADFLALLTAVLRDKKGEQVMSGLLD